MKVSVNKWPVTLTIEVEEDFFFGIEEVKSEEDLIDKFEVEKTAKALAKALIHAKGFLLAQKEAESKQ